MRLGWSATPPGQNPAYRPTRHHPHLVQNVLQATGTITTTIDDHVYRQPANRT
jgi:hypothetical protein